MKILCPQVRPKSRNFPPRGARRAVLSTEGGPRVYVELRCCLVVRPSSCPLTIPATGSQRPPSSARGRGRQTGPCSTQNARYRRGVEQTVYWAYIRFFPWSPSHPNHMPMSRYNAPAPAPVDGTATEPFRVFGSSSSRSLSPATESMMSRGSSEELVAAAGDAFRNGAHNGPLLKDGPLPVAFGL